MSPHGCEVCPQCLQQLPVPGPGPDPPHETRRTKTTNSSRMVDPCLPTDGGSIVAAGSDTLVWGDLRTGAGEFGGYSAERERPGRLCRPYGSAPEGRDTVDRIKTPPYGEPHTALGTVGYEQLCV